MKKKQPAARPGGRSSRVKTIVFDAVEALMAENPRAIPGMAAIAARAGVNPTSLYRRWGDATALVVEVAVERLKQDYPMPDTGSLRGDLLGWAMNVARSLNGTKTLALLRVLASVVQTGERPAPQRLGAVTRRGQDIQDVLERAAPMYFRVLFIGPMGGADDVARLVDRVLAMARRR
jgi:AcrR family transcriptional regulator